MPKVLPCSMHTGKNKAEEERERKKKSQPNWNHCICTWIRVENYHINYNFICIWLKMLGSKCKWWCSRREIGYIEHDLRQWQQQLESIDADHKRWARAHLTSEPLHFSCWTHIYCGLLYTFATYRSYEISELLGFWPQNLCALSVFHVKSQRMTHWQSEHL